jgi:DNA-binding protein Fis
LNNNNKNIYSVIIEKVEKSLIENILDYTNGNQLKASEILGLNRNTLRKKIGDLSIDLKFNDKD